MIWNRKRIINVLNNIILPMQKLGIIAFILLFIFCNLLFLFLPFRIDLSKGKAYSLSLASQNIVKELKMPVTFTLYISSDIPVRVLPLKKDVVDFLKEYKNTNTNKIKFIIKDPKKDTEAKKEAIKEGIPQIQFSEVESDQYKVSTAFFGLVIQYNTEKTIIPQVVNIQTLEYDVSSALFKMSRNIPQTISFVHFPIPADSNKDAFFSFKQIIDKQYTTAELPTNTQKDTLLFSNSNQVALVYAGKESLFNDNDSKQLDLFLQSGGNIILFADGITISDTLAVSPAKHNLFTFLKKHGLILHKDLVLSYDAQTATFATDKGAFVVRYPLWVLTNVFYKKSMDFENISQLMFPWASSITTTQNKKGTILTSSTKTSWRQTENFIVMPNKIPSPDKSSQQSIPLILETKQNRGILTLIPTSHFVKEQFLNQSSGNIEFIVNLVNRYSSAGALSGIQSRANQTSPIRRITSQEKDIVRYMILFTTPVIFMVCGFLRMIQRKKREHAIVH